ncbi:kinase binding protein CGI-121-domain-containing protein [Gilbertella persicaria]|uniref:kinase binding protein CGI-121-domain-containing protein n=1 Tax=Gilbertella persicaria TaxID=101096 RepID=UPI00221FDD31|nr:kinase binding protein CGI-121-domain-containing protein [Gilbertella persicaria]KAI8087874.1 kinase binding protein CGI-121-domain-containing protein [Gilbertella persicaria]
MESYTLELFPDKQVHIALFQNVKNASELRQRIHQQDITLNMALVNASLVLDKFIVLLAAQRALSDEAAGSLKTYSLHSEILFNFGGTNNIGKTLTTFGITDQTTHMVAIQIGEPADKAEMFLKQTIQGDLVSFNQLETIKDKQAIQKAYHVKNNQDDLVSFVTGQIALRGHI